MSKQPLNFEAYNTVPSIWRRQLTDSRESIEHLKFLPI